MGSIGKIQVNGKEILMVDYSFMKEPEMIELLKRTRQLILDENKVQLILSNVSNSYATPGFLNAVRELVPGVSHLIEKQAVIGVNTPKRWIIKGLNLVLKANYMAFETREEAITYLTS